MRKCLIALFFLVALSGCAAKVVKPDPAETQLSNAFVRIADSMETLAKISSAEHSQDYAVKEYDYDEARMSPAFLQQIDLVQDFHGDLTSFIEMMSKISGLENPRIDTPRTGRPVVIAVAKGKRRLISFIADAANQAGDAATLIPSINNNVVVIKYNTVSTRK